MRGGIGWGCGVSDLIQRDELIYYCFHFGAYIVVELGYRMSVKGVGVRSGGSWVFAGVFYNPMF